MEGSALKASFIRFVILFEVVDCALRPMISFFIFLMGTVKPKHVQRCPGRSDEIEKKKMKAIVLIAAQQER